MQNTHRPLQPFMNHQLAFLFRVFFASLSLNVALSGTELVAQSALETADVIYRDIGTWSDHLPYSHAQEAVYCGKTSTPVGNDGFWAVRVENALFLVLPDGSIQTISKVNGMSGSNPSALAWDVQGQMLVVGYASGVIDFFSNEGVRLFTMSDIKDSNLIGDKTIHKLVPAVSTDPDRIYAACGFGIVVINPREFDVRDTWFIEGQQELRSCHGLQFHEGQIVVWTDAGIFEADQDHPFLSAPDAWTRWDDIPLETGDYRHVIFHPNGQPIVHRKTGTPEQPDELWWKSNGVWVPLPQWEGSQVYDITAGSISSTPGDWIMAIADYQSIHLFNSGFEPIQLDYTADGVPLRARHMVFHHREIEDPSGPSYAFEDLFIANQEEGLLQLDITGAEMDDHWSPSGPPTSLVRCIDAWNDQMWVASGGVDETWTSMYHKYGFYGLNGTRWEWIPPSEGENDIAGINDAMVVSIDPTNPNHAFFGTWEEGLIEVLDGELVETYNSTNSTLQSANFGGSPRIGVGGVDFDSSGNLWFTNARVAEPLQVRLSNGTFIAMDVGNAMGTNGWMGDVLAARNGYIWCIMPRNQGLLVYDTNQTPGETSDDDWRLLTDAVSQGGLPSNDIYSIEEDLDGEIWIGTSAGPCVVYLPSSIFDLQNSNPVASQILIQQDGNYQLLLETEIIRSICIDGGNRKWLGTQNSGLYLLSPDGATQEAHFTDKNSALLSNAIFDIAINHRNGETFIGTAQGLMAWRSDATNFVVEIDAIEVYPNPVRSDFEGLIAINGLAYESAVHITTSSGRLIAMLESHGGRAVWDGKDMNGTDVPHGVYVIWATDSDGNSAGTTKLAVTR
jgi:ligand-binding sensor domain-containing protein